MDLIEPVAPLCVYTITHGDRLRYFYNLGGLGELSEGKRWVRAEALLAAAREFGMRFLVLFAAAEDPRQIIYFARLDSIRLHEISGRAIGTDYTFSELTSLRKAQLFKTSLINEATRRPIPPGYMRPYLICRTPDSLLKSKLSAKRAHQTHSSRLR